MGKTGLLVRMCVSASGNAMLIERKGYWRCNCTDNDGQRNTRDRDTLIRHGHVHRVPVTGIRAQRAQQYSNLDVATVLACLALTHGSGTETVNTQSDGTVHLAPAHLFPRSSKIMIMNRCAPPRFFFLFCPSPPVPMLQTWMLPSAETLLRVFVGNVASCLLRTPES
jgi:hypothetical protein